MNVDCTPTPTVISRASITTEGACRQNSIARQPRTPVGETTYRRFEFRFPVPNYDPSSRRESPQQSGTHPSRLVPILAINDWSDAVTNIVIYKFACKDSLIHSLIHSLPSSLVLSLLNPILTLLTTITQVTTYSFYCYESIRFINSLKTFSVQSLFQLVPTYRY